MAAADGNRLALQLRIIALLHGCVEGVHVDMNDLPCSPGSRMRKGVRGRVSSGHDGIFCPTTAALV
jgi:hypothetical protein